MNFFPKPVKRPGNAGPPAPLPYRPRPKAEVAWTQPWPRVDATFVALLGLVITAFAIVNAASQRSSNLAHIAAIGVGCTLLASFAFEARGGVRNLVRADLMGNIAFYYLTLYEFLFPQPAFDVEMSDIKATYLALWALLIGFAGLFIGRHLLPRGRQPFERIMTGPVNPRWLIAIYAGCFFLGFLNMLIAVKFDLADLVDAMTRPRFDRPWGRGKFGDWKALLGELNMLLYLVPPITGLMVGRRERYAWPIVLFALFGFAWVLFYAFADGTRAVFGAYLITFMIAFTFSSPPTRRREIVIVCALCAAALGFSTKAMIEMRGIGFKRWWNEDRPASVHHGKGPVFVDGDLLAIARITQFFPARNNGHYLGLEIPYLALVRPIPRAIWPGKPTGMSRTIEEAYGATQMTVAATFVGEGYMSGGLFAVALEALILGLMAAFWNRLASPRNSELGILIYASGFFAVIITMRSTFALTTAILPSIVGLLFGKFIIPKIRARFGRKPALQPSLRNQPPPPVEP